MMSASAPDGPCINVDASSCEEPCSVRFGFDFDFIDFGTIARDNVLGKFSVSFSCYFLQTERLHSPHYK
jgi:hypothetical protein